MNKRRERKKPVSFVVMMVMLMVLGIIFVIVLLQNKYDIFNFNVGSFEFVKESFIVVDIPKEPVVEQVEQKNVVPDLSKTMELDHELLADSIYFYDLTHEKLIYSKNPEKKVAPASLTKIMTAIIVLELEDDIDNTVLTYKESMGDEILLYGYELTDIAAYEYEDGEQMTVKDALYVLMLRSANDTANLLAEYYGDGSLDRFVDMMNAKAVEIGAENTNFSNTHGLDEQYLYTTAYDMFLIFDYALNLPGFLEIVGTLQYELSPNNIYEKRNIENVLGILNPNYTEYYYPQMIGAKSGYTSSAGRCLVSVVERDEKRFLLVIMGVPILDEEGSKYPSALFYEESIFLYDMVV